MSDLLRERNCLRGRRQDCAIRPLRIAIRFWPNRLPSLPRKHLRPLVTAFMNNPG